MNAQATLDGYLNELAAAAASTGLRSAQMNDPDGCELAKNAIRDVAAFGWAFSADDLHIPVRTNAIGAAFSALAKAGEIHQVGYTVSRVASRHGGLIRTWAGSGVAAP